MPDTHAPPAPGICTDCGCSEANPCDGGCSWADEDRTLCSRCAGIQVQTAALQLGNALASLLCAIYVLEEVSGELEPEVRDQFNAAFGDTSRLFANVTQSVMALLVDHPEALEVAKTDPRRIIVP